MKKENNMEEKIKKITYRQYKIPAIIFEGKWIEKKYGLKVGDKIMVELSPEEIKLKMVKI